MSNFDQKMERDRQQADYAAHQRQQNHMARSGSDDALAPLAGGAMVIFLVGAVLDTILKAIEPYWLAAERFLAWVW